MLQKQTDTSSNQTLTGLMINLGVSRTYKVLEFLAALFLAAADYIAHC
jgi:hypothetical protein